MNPIKSPLSAFDSVQISIVNESVAMAEELVLDFYKMSSSQWLHLRYDVKTLDGLHREEIIDGPFAQVIRYEGRRENRLLSSSSYDFYKICLQDHTILKTLTCHTDIGLYPFALYIVTHELIHVVRFGKFLQLFNASGKEKEEEERRVHQHTREVLMSENIDGINAVFSFFRKWCDPLETLA